MGKQCMRIAMMDFKVAWGYNSTGRMSAGVPCDGIDVVLQQNN